MRCKNLKKALSLLIALAMCLSLFAVPVFAEDAFEESNEAELFETGEQLVPTISNIVTDDSVIAANGAKKIIDAEANGLVAVANRTYTSADGENWQAQAEAAKASYQKAIDDVNTALLSEYGENAAAGSSVWATFPSVAWSAYSSDITTGLTNPGAFTAANTNVEGAFVNGRGYVFKSTKGGTPTAENPGVFGQNAEYFTFDINVGGTMYLVDLNNRGYKGATDAGYEKLTGAKIVGNSNVYAKHFDAGKVVVPAQDIQNLTYGQKIYESPGFVFVFDDITIAELETLTYTDGFDVTIDVTSDVIDVVLGEAYTGGVVVTGTAAGGGSVEPVVIDVVNGEGSGTITVTAMDRVTKKQYTVNFRKLIPTISNIVSEDSAIAANGAKKIIDAEANGLVAVANRTYKEATDGGDWKAKAEAAKTSYQKAIDDVNTALLSECGENAAAGSSVWATFPYVVWSAFSSNITTGLTNPSTFTATNTNVEGVFVNERGYVLKSTKGGTPTAENPGVFGKNAEYLTFYINSPGTMYLVDLTNRGYKGATDAGYEKLTGAKIAGNSNVYAKHFDEGKVVVPAQDIQNLTYGTKIYESPGFVFVFDDRTAAELDSVTYTINEEENTVKVVGDTINIETSSYYTGDVTVSGKALNSGSVSPVTISLVGGEGSGTITVTSIDGSAHKTYTVNFKKPAPTISNIVSEDSAIAENGAKKIIDAAANGLNATASVTYTAANGEDWKEQAAAARAVHQKAIDDANAALLSEYGENAAAGSSVWATYPAVAWSAFSSNITTRLDNPGVFTAANTNVEGAFVNGRGYVLKSTKGGIPTAENPGVFGKNAEYLTFDVSLSGTMYLTDRNGMGYQGALDAGYEKLTGVRIAESENVYAKHFEAGKVVVPAQDIADLTYGTRITNTPGFVFVFDDITVAELDSVTYTIDEKESTVKVEGDTINITTSSYYTGDVTVSGKATNGGSVSPVTISLTDGEGSGTITVTSKDESATKNYTIVFKVDNNAKITVSVTGGTVLASVNGGEAADFGASKTEYFRKGDEIVMTAVPTDANAVFMFWKDMSNNAILSTEETVTIKVGTAKEYQAIFSDNNSGAYVTFRANGRIAASGYSGAVSVPAEPYVAGYTFAGWFNGGKRVELTAGETVSVAENTFYYAGFVLDNKEYTVTINGAAEQHKYNDKVTVAADETNSEGKFFAYWMNDGQIVSYSKTYSFFVYKDTVLTAVYADAVPEEQVTLVMAQPIKMEETNRIAFYAERNVPLEYTVIETGMLLNPTADFDLASAQIVAVSKSTANNGQYTVRKANVSVGDTWYGKAYLIYSDGTKVYTIYSNEVSQTF